MPATTRPLSRSATALIVLTGVLLTSCASVDIGGPRARKSNPLAGILQLSSGKQIAVLPGEFNYTGRGAYTWPDGRQQAGTWHSGRLQGMGTEKTGSETYTGQWHEGKRHGHGELDATTGQHYVGAFVAGLPQGKGTETGIAGVYRGQWHGGHRQGQGQYNAADGGQYQGQWRDGLRAGYGQEKHANGAIYEGDWLHDKPNGFGRHYYATAATYEGHWRDGKRQGYGIWISPAEVKYEGTWLRDKQHGFGKETRPDGSHFAGEWQAGERHGLGTEIHPDNSTHKGLWQNDEISGPGRRTNRMGIITTGAWLQNSITVGSLILPGGATYEGALFNPAGRVVAPDLRDWLSRQAKAKNPYAQYFLGTVYLDFDDPEPDPITAKVWLQRAAREGVAEAEFRLSVLLLDDDVQSSVIWLQSAAKQNHPTANEVLGEYFHTGQHVPKNLSTAIKHYEQAAHSGSVVAINNLAWLLATAQDNRVADPRRAVDLIRPFVLYLGSWQHLDTLAAAHARLGDTALAERMQNQALIQARSLASQEVVAEMAARLELYAKDQAYTE